MGFSQDNLKKIGRIFSGLVKDTKLLLKALDQGDVTDSTLTDLQKRRQLQAAEELLRAAGYRVSYGPEGSATVGPAPSGGGQGSGGGRSQRPGSAGGGSGNQLPPPAGGAFFDGFPDIPKPPVFQPAGGRFTPAAPPIREILTPQSSNVYSFAYYRRQGDKLGTLYVRFKAHEVNLRAASVGKGKLGGKQQLHGILGKTVGKQTDGPGPMYAYYAVPVDVYNRMQSASSKGEFVWDALCVRGSIYGHQYQYQLVEGFDVPGSGGLQYVPRRATAKGFKVRSVADSGSGRRRFVSSTLESQSGHQRINLGRRR